MKIDTNGEGGKEGNRAFFESYDCVRVRLPEHGLDFTCKPLLVKDAARFLRTMMSAQSSDETERGLAMLSLLEEFPVAIGAEKELSGLLPAEIYELVTYFFTLNRLGMKREQPVNQARPIPAMATPD